VSNFSAIGILESGATRGGGPIAENPMLRYFAMPVVGMKSGVENLPEPCRPRDAN